MEIGTVEPTTNVPGRISRGTYALCLRAIVFRAESDMPKVDATLKVDTKR